MLRIELNQDGDLSLKGLVSLTKGVNEVDEEAWGKVADDEITQWYVKRRIVVVVRQVPTVEEVMARGYDEVAAHRIVAEQQALAGGKSELEASRVAKAAAERFAASKASAPPDKAPLPPGPVKSDEVVEPWGDDTPDVETFVVFYDDTLKKDEILEKFGNLDGLELNERDTKAELLEAVHTHLYGQADAGKTSGGG